MLNEVEQIKLQELIQLGKEGKLWSIEVYYYMKDHADLHRWSITNYTTQQMMTFREKIFRVGLMIAKDPGHYFIVCPYNIHEITVEKQSRYFD